MQGGLVTNVISQHPAGLIQSLIDAHDVQLADLRWSSNRDICDEGHPTNCGPPVITFEPGGPDNPAIGFSSGVRFKNVKLQIPRCSKAFNISEESGRMPLSREITVDGLTIDCSRVPATEQGSQGIITLRSTGTHLTNVHYIPRRPTGTTADRQNYLAVIRSRSTDTTVEMTIDGGRDSAKDPSAFKCVVEEHRNNNNCLINASLR
jgi:hypothetical protein